MRIIYIIILSLTFSCFLPGSVVGGELVTEFVQKVNQPFGGSQSPDEARSAGIAKGKAEALERAGTYLESYTLVEDFVLQKDETLALTAGVLKTEVISQENYATQEGFGMILDLQVVVDKSLLEKRLEQIQTDQALLRKYTELQAREAALLARIKKLEAMTGDDQSERGRAVDTVDEYRSAIQALPAVGLNRKALELWGAGKFTNPEEALALLDTALSLDPNNSLTINNRGVALYQLGRRKEALAAFGEAIELAPEYSDAYNNRGVIYMAQHDYQAAEMEFSKVIELAPLRVDAYINRGVARKNLWKHHLALEDYKKALTIDTKGSTQKSAEDSANLDFNELGRICDKAQRACRLNLCRALDYLKKQDLCQVE